MSEQVKQETTRGQDLVIPAKCADCPFLDKEFDPWSKTTHLYCRAPFWHPKRWFCALPDKVQRA